MSTQTKSINARVIDPSGWDDGTFLVEGRVDNDEAHRRISEALDRALGQRGWSGLVVKGTSTWRGDWSGNRFEARADGNHWTYVVADYETPDQPDYWSDQPCRGCGCGKPTTTEDAVAMKNDSNEKVSTSPRADFVEAMAGPSGIGFIGTTIMLSGPVALVWMLISVAT